MTLTAMSRADAGCFCGSHLCSWLWSLVSQILLVCCYHTVPTQWQSTIVTLVIHCYTCQLAMAVMRVCIHCCITGHNRHQTQPITVSTGKAISIVQTLKVLDVIYCTVVCKRGIDLLFVYLSDVCSVIKWTNVDILVPHERSVALVYCTEKVSGRHPLQPKILDQSHLG